MAKHRRITEHRVRSLPAKATRYQINEDNLQLEVNPSGRKVFYAYGWQGGKKFKTKLGEYPRISVKDARAAVAKLVHEKHEGVRIVQDPSTFEAFVEGPFKDWVLGERKQGEATMKRIRFQWIPEFGHRKLRDITQQDIERAKAKSAKKYKPATVKRNLGDLRRIFSKAVEWDMLKKSPAVGVSDPKVTSYEKLYLTNDEMRRLNDALAEWDRIAFSGKWIHGEEEEAEDRLTDAHSQRQYFNPELSRFVRLIVNTGLRKSEALSLQWRDFEVGNGRPPSITVRAEVSKTGKPRTVPINAKLADELKSFLDLPENYRRSTRPMFTLRDPKKGWSRLRKMAGLEHLTLHHLRHNFASQLILKGAAPSVVMRLMGHTSLNTTMLYLSIRPEDAFEAVNLL